MAVQRPWFRRRQALLGVLAVGAAACGGDKGPLDWIDERAAVVHCTAAGRSRMPPVLLGLPVPRVPQGLYARSLDPMALDDLGIQRGAVTCAMLLAPTVDEARTVQADVEALAKVRAKGAAAATAVAGRCVCEAAGVSGLRALVPACLREPTQTVCDPETNRVAVAAALEPVVAQVARTSLPLVQWRMVGKMDRPGWFKRQEQDLLSRFETGSTVFYPGKSVPERGNAALVRVLLDVDGVVAVVRQDSGRSLAVLRELHDELVIDHFAYAAAGAELGAMIAALDNARADEYVARLAKPTATRKLMHDPRDGNLVEVDVARLAPVDMVVAAGAVLAGLELEPDERELPASFVDRASFQAPFGKDGQVLRATVVLSEAGRAWALLLSDELLSPKLTELNLDKKLPAADTLAEELPYRVRGEAVEHGLIYGLHRLPDVMARVEMEFPDSVKGEAQQWRFDMPASDLAGVFGADAVAPGLRQAFGTKPYRVTMEMDRDREQLSLEASPR